jgi:signal transduction histidine kinase
VDTAPSESTLQAALVDDQRIDRLNETLCRRTVELAASTEHLQRDLLRHQVAEATLKRIGNQHARLLAEAGRLQDHFRRLTHQLLATQEEERQRIGRLLQDEIVQLLVGINVRLLALQQAARGRTASLHREIASTQRLVLESTRMLHQSAHELDVQDGGVK